MSSILSFPNRGPWGKSSWRGNCSGYIYKELFERLQPKSFIDCMVGSGTSIDVAKEMGIEAYGLDLHSGFNVLRDSIVMTVGKEVDLVLSHPPYGGLVKYSNNQWGTEAHPDDLSHCNSDAEFHEKMQLALINQRDATKNGGHYGTIIGDWRRNGVYTSYQAECIARMPADELVAVIIKAQHNTTSGRKSYGKLKLPFILHEYILLWEKKSRSIYHLLGTIANEQAARLRGTWKVIVRNIMMRLGGKASLSDIYDAVSNCAPDKVQQNAHWKEKIRQTLNSSVDYFSPERGVWSIA